MMKTVIESVLFSLCISLVISFATGIGNNTRNSSHNEATKEDDEFFSQPVTSLQILASAPIITSSSRTTDAFSYLLSWKPNALLSTIKCYKIRFRKDEQSWTYKTVDANATQLLLNNLDSSSLYEVEMIRLSRGNESSKLAMSSFRTGSKKKNSKNNGKKSSPIFQDGKKSNRSTDAQVPGAPNPFVTNPTATSVFLTWLPRSNGGSPITGYKVQMRGPKKRSKWRTIKTLSADIKSFQFTKLNRADPYKFRVIAINEIGESAPSQAVVYKAKPNPDFRVPPQIRDVEILNGSVLIHWTYEAVDPKKIQGFIIKYTVGTKQIRRKVKNPLASTFSIKSPKHTIKYSVIIQAYNGKETSSESHPLRFSVVRDHTKKKDVINFTGSHVIPPETHMPSEVPRGPRNNPDHNDEVKKKSNQRDLAFIIGGAVLFCVIGVLLISCIVYHKQKKRGKRKRSGRIEKQSSTLCNKLFGATCRDEPESPPAPPSPPRCSCYSGASSPMRANGSCLTSNRTSMSHNVPPENGLVSCSRVPGNMYAVYYDYSPGRPPPPCLATPGVPLCWVRGEGEFCHIIPHNARPKMIEEPNLSRNGSLRTTTSSSRTPASSSATSRDPEVIPEEVHLMEKDSERSEET